MSKKYRFYFHYYKAKKCLSIHWQGACHQVRDVKVLVPTESKWNKRQPMLVIQGWASEVEFSEDGCATIK